MEGAAKRLPARRIEGRASVLLIEYEARFGVLCHPPVPVDEILENFLKLHLEFDDLRKHGLEGAHAVTYADLRRVVIDESLDPVEHPQKEGRVNFTIAHEIGHLVLRHPRTPHPPVNPDPQWLDGYREMERQADQFAAYLLMPRRLVLQEWQAQFSHPGPLVITPEMERDARANGFSREDFIRAFAEEHSRELAAKFRVSVEAMRIRLQELGLVPRQ